MITPKDEEEAVVLAKLIGDAIRERRTTWPGGNMTLKELSNRTGIAISTLSNYENGKCLPSLEAALKIAHVLGLDLNALSRVPQNA